MTRAAALAAPPQPVAAPDPLRPPSTSDAAYGIGYLSVRYLVSKYGQAKMLAFWGDVERDGDSVNTAAQKEFSTSWTTVNSACASYVRQNA